MHAHLTSRIQKICNLSSDVSLTVANAMIKACKEAFPCLNSDLRAHYLSAKMKLEGLEENNNDDTIWLLEFRQSIHSQLSQKVQKNQACCSEIVDLILSYFDNFQFSLPKPIKTTKNSNNSEKKTKADNEPTTSTTDTEVKPDTDGDKSSNNSVWRTPIRRSERRPKKNQNDDINQKLQIITDDSKLPLAIKFIPGKNFGIVTTKKLSR